MGMAFCSNFQWKSLFFQSLSKRRLFAVLYFLTGPFLLFLTLAIGSSHKADFNMSATIGAYTHIWRDVALFVIHLCAPEVLV
jgi:hypothetical protein